MQEWGVGNGNLAARFLSRLKSADTDQTVYPRIHYTLCDYSEEILNGVRANPNLQEHEGRYFLKQSERGNAGRFRAAFGA